MTTTGRLVVVNEVHDHEHEQSDMVISSGKDVEGIVQFLNNLLHLTAEGKVLRDKAVKLIESK